jgi:V/A-type H+-transporting ATPase subunit G/H
VEAAEADKRTAIANARRDSVGRIQTAEAKAREAAEAAMAKEKVKAAAKREELLGEGTAEAKKLEASAEHRMQKIKDFLNKEVERTLNVAS